MFTGEIDAYILSHIDEEGDLLSALNRDANVNLLRPRMLSGHLQGRILKMFCRMLRPRRVLELEVRADNLYSLCTEHRRPANMDYTEKLIRI